MAFNIANWANISSSGNVPSITLGNGVIQGAPGIYSYQSVLETIAAITATDYFVEVGPTMSVGDLIYIYCSNANALYQVLQVDITLGTVIIAEFANFPEAMWVDATTSPIALTATTHYVADSASLVTFTVPAAPAFGETYEIVGKGTGGWKIQMGAGQVVNLGDTPSTSGGSLASTNRFDTCNLVCVTTPNTFVVRYCIGNITVA